MKMSLRKSSMVNLSAFAVVTMGTVTGEVMDLRLLVYVCKPLMMLVLSSWFFFNTRRVGDRFTLLVQAGLFFSLVGDIALMLQHLDEFNFLIGLGAFLIAQLCYMIAFIQNIIDVGPGRAPWTPLSIAFLLLVYGYLFADRLLPTVDEDVRVPVTIYAITITLMGMTAAFRWGRTYTRSFLLVLGGALFFIGSDSLLACNRFISPFASASWAVMITYAIAQAFIVSGTMAHVLDPEEARRRAALRT